MKVLLRHSLQFLENQDNNVSRPSLLPSAMLIEPSNILRLVFHLQVVVCLLAWEVLVWVALVWEEERIQDLQLFKLLSKTLPSELFVNE